LIQVFYWLLESGVKIFFDFTGTKIYMSESGHAGRVHPVEPDSGKIEKISHMPTAISFIALLDTIIKFRINTIFEYGKKIFIITS
jgi:hypothetical protein